MSLKLKSENKTLPPIVKLLLLTFFLKGIVISAILPIWHGPDEQAHFAQVQYFGEFGHPVENNVNVKDLSQEILLSENLLGTERDGFGKNKFTHNPNYRIEYTNTLTGKYEQILHTIPISARKMFVKNEATRYPPLYYYFSAIFYRLSYSLDLFNRVFITRFGSIILGTLTVLLTYKIAEKIFSKKSIIPLTAATLVAFQPMFGFLSSSINSDNLMNFLFTGFLFWCVDILIAKKLSFKNLFLLVILMLAGFLTKPHFVIAFPILIILAVFLLPDIKSASRRHPKKTIFILLTVLVLSAIRFRSNIIDVYEGRGLAFSEISLKSLRQPNFDISLATHTSWTLKHTVAEVVPWYWGVFNWLGVTLPRAVNRVINRLLILASLGLVFWAFKNRRFKKWTQIQKSIVFLVLSSLIFFTVLLFWDWLFVRGHSFSFGLQGRYYFPTISAHMMLVLVGLLSLIPSKLNRMKNRVAKLIGTLMVVLSLIGLHTITTAYYKIFPLDTFLNQVSQYKPIFFKSPFIVFWFALYFISLSVFIYQYVTYKKSRS